MSCVAARRSPWIFALSLAWTGCAGLPDYARPMAEVRGLEDYGAGDVIPYRALRRADFLASAPPPQVEAHAASLRAYTCANISPDPDQRVEMLPEAAGSYRARLTRFHFRAEMDRSCSWWNPRPVRLPDEYILQHEQIHFAIVEVSARRLTARVRGV